jgi:hypothetical protein
VAEPKVTTHLSKFSICAGTARPRGRNLEMRYSSPQLHAFCGVKDGGKSSSARH